MYDFLIGVTYAVQVAGIVAFVGVLALIVRQQGRP